MAYWLTTHWPPRADNPDSIATGVWLPDKREIAGKDFRSGDLVLIYQARTGRTKIARDIAGIERRVPCLRGREGIIAIAEATGPFEDDATPEAENYTDGSSVWWRWSAPLKVLSRSGFVPRARVNDVLGYKTGYNYRGFGVAHSGLAQITGTQFKALAQEFRRSLRSDLPDLPVLPRFREGPGGERIESEDHLALKLFVARQPEVALGEEGLVLIRIEYPFPTGDRSDIVLQDRLGRIVGVEIEVDVRDNDWEGPLQAIKYRRMLEPLTCREPGDSRSMLVAYSISAEMRSECAKYDVECFSLNRDTVKLWRAANPNDGCT